MIAWEKIKIIFSDFDGVFTDNRVIVSENGTESVICSRADGMGIQLLKPYGVRVIVVSSETNCVVKARCKKLKIKCLNAVGDKHKVVQEIVETEQIRAEEICFIGNDLNDLECIENYQGIAVADAVQIVKTKAAYITRAEGGAGAIREIADLIIQQKQAEKP